MYMIEGGGRRWKEHINLKEDKEAKNTVSEREWVQDQVEKSWKIEEEKAEWDCQLKAAYSGLFDYKE